MWEFQRRKAHLVGRDDEEMSIRGYRHGMGHGRCKSTEAGNDLADIEKSRELSHQSTASEGENQAGTAGKHLTGGSAMISSFVSESLNWKQGHEGWVWNLGLERRF